MTLLQIKDLVLDLPDGTRLLNGVTLTVEAGETVALVGESGSGKSLTSRTVLGLLPIGARTTGTVMLDGTDMLTASKARTLAMRRNTVSMVFQDPRSGINPVRTVGDYLTESLRACHGWPAAKANARALSLLKSVGMPRPEAHLRQYPHEFSGGMLQRVMIAGAMTTSPALLVCDEPTSALDVTTQAEIVAVLKRQQAELNTGMLFITHDLNLAAAMCDRVYVIHAGEIVEQGPAEEIFANPQHPYSKKLVAATPRLTDDDGLAPIPASSPAAAAGSAAVVVNSLSKSYRTRGGDTVRAVNDVSFTVPKGGSLALVGESGSGKSTLARMLVGLEAPDSGEILINGALRTAGRLSRADRLARARTAQIVFQDPYLSLDPRIPAGKAIEDALKLHNGLDTTAARKRVLTLLDQVGLPEAAGQARPRTLSGGQRQRVAIARALAVGPEILVLDEATSALDVSVQSQVLDLIDAIRAERGLTIVFVSHDLAVVRRVCEVSVVLQAGAAVEAGNTRSLLDDPQHPYTRLLIDSIPRPEWKLAGVK
jgi:peptide/nickel transport system ATP-binding protein